MWLSNLEQGKHRSYTRFLILYETMRPKCTELTTPTKIVDISLGYRTYIGVFEGPITFLNLSRIPILAAITLGHIPYGINVDLSNRCTTKRGSSIMAVHNVVIYLAHCTLNFLVNKSTFIFQLSIHPCKITDSRG